jgi:putative spermidine/putrescine transport system permease protein
MQTQSERRRARLLLFPAVLFVAVCFLYPLGTYLLGSFNVDGGFGLEHYIKFLSSEVSLEVYWRTVRIAFLVTLVSAVFSYPVALLVVRLPPQWRALMTGLIIVPLMVSPVARTFSWLVVLGREGMFNRLLLETGLTSEPVRILYTETAVFIGLLQLMMPLMLLSLTSALDNMPRDVIPAARSLGADTWVTFWRVILPLTRDGLTIGGTLVFTGSITAYVTPALLGGPQVTLLATLLYQNASVTVNEAATSVISVVMLLTTLIVNWGLRWRGSRAA